MGGVSVGVFGDPNSSNLDCATGETCKFHSRPSSSSDPIQEPLLFDSMIGSKCVATSPCTSREESARKYVPPEGHFATANLDSR